MSRVDFGRHADDYAAFRPGPPASFYERVDAIAPIGGARVLDLGTGPGTVALEFASLGASVVGVDISPELIATAQRLAKDHDLAHVAAFRVASAESTDLNDDSFDLVTACQCWHWFDQAEALREARRVLRPGGHLFIIYYSYLARHSALARDSEELILQFNPSWTMAGWTGLFPAHIDEVIDAGFQFVEAFCYDHEEPFSHARWRGRMRTCNGVGSGALSTSEVEEFDAALDELLKERYPEPVHVPHRVWCVAARNPR